MHRTEFVNNYIFLLFLVDGRLSDSPALAFAEVLVVRTILLWSFFFLVDGRLSFEATRKPDTPSVPAPREVEVGILDSPALAFAEVLVFRGGIVSLKLNKILTP